MEKLKRLTFDLPVNIHNELKSIVYKKGITIKDVFIELSINYIEQDKINKEKK